ncbi:MAG: Spy/CpxP family protein refolding chaperone [Gemmatimonadota bacterium]|nr:Spy/CpxP family protein refolding chaperone [Gemmatimonadota bacterium]MDH5805420.1 Spy/CpxP family protein refolding chaperone [Gemmatimonadota bacterium]
MRFGILLLALGASPLSAQHDHRSPYSGEHNSEIPSLTEEEIRQYRAGEGMGFARAAELNHFPGPRHVLDLGQEIDLSEDQRAEIEEIFNRMQAEAIELGGELLERETELNMRFRHAHIDEQSLSRMVEEVAVLRGRIRFVHLRAHLETTALLSEEQVAAYDRLRGYVEERAR